MEAIAVDRTPNLLYALLYRVEASGILGNRGGRVEREKKKRGNYLLPAVLCAVPLLLTGAYCYFASGKALAQRAVDCVSLPVRRGLGALCAHVPFSVMELLCTLLGAGLIAYLALAITAVVKSSQKLRTLLKRLAALVIVGLYIAAGALWLWGLDYKACSFSEKECFQAKGVTTEELYGAAEYFLEHTLALADSVPRDDSGLFAADREQYFSRFAHLYDPLEELFPSITGATHKPKEMTLYSGLMSQMGFTGVYFCFTGESNINIDQPEAFIPFTVAHELAHQRGVASEQECNFLGVMAGVLSGIPEYEYSCSLMGTIYLMNALYKASPEQWRELQNRIGGPVKADMDENSRYWSARETRVEKASKKAYDVYLKANGQSLGIESYGACVDLLVEFYQKGKDT